MCCGGKGMLRGWLHLYVAGGRGSKRACSALPGTSTTSFHSGREGTQVRARAWSQSKRPLMCGLFSPACRAAHGVAWQDKASACLATGCCWQDMKDGAFQGQNSMVFVQEQPGPSATGRGPISGRLPGYACRCCARIILCRPHAQKDPSWAPADQQVSAAYQQEGQERDYRRITYQTSDFG